MRNKHKNVSDFSKLLLLIICAAVLLAFASRQCPSANQAAQHTDIRLSESDPETPPDPNAPAYAIHQ